jgi:hypothetical protein
VFNSLQISFKGAPSWGKYILQIRSICLENESSIKQCADYTISYPLTLSNYDEFGALRNDDSNEVAVTVVANGFYFFINLFFHRSDYDSAEFCFNGAYFHCSHYTFLNYSSMARM